MTFNLQKERQGGKNTINTSKSLFSAQVSLSAVISLLPNSNQSELRSIKEIPRTKTSFYKASFRQSHLSNRNRDRHGEQNTQIPK